MTSLLHFLLLIAQAGIFFCVSRVLSPFIAFTLIAAWCIFLRELTQKQSAKYNNNFFSGWAFWQWQEDKQNETFNPIYLSLFLAGIATWWFS